MKILNNKGEGRINTAVKIIIAVVVGALILGGLYVLVSAVIIPNTNAKIQDMMHYEESASSYRYDAFDTKVSSLEYSYDGANWQKSSVPNLSEAAVIKKSLNVAEDHLNIVFVNDNDRLYLMISEDNGAHWTIAYNAGQYNFTNVVVEYYLYKNANGSYTAMARTYDGETSTSGWGYEIKSNDGHTWYRDTLGIDFF